MDDESEIRKSVLSKEEVERLNYFVGERYVPFSARDGPETKDPFNSQRDYLDRDYNP